MQNHIARPRHAAALLVALSLLAATIVRAAPPGTQLTYQGMLQDGSTAAAGNYDMRFTLYDAATGGGTVGPTLVFDGAGPNPPPVAVSDGLFTVELDFGPVFMDAALWLEIDVRPSGGGAYTTLAPRQRLTAAPFSLQTRGIVVDAANDVGIGTSTPEHLLHVAGDFRTETRTAQGNDANFGLGGGPWPQFDRVHDFSHVITDFSSSEFWAPLLATVSLDPDLDLTGVNTKQVYANGFECHISANSDKTLDFVNGLYGASSHRGSGHVYNNLGNLLGGVLEGPGTITWNFGIAATAGCGWGSTGHIENNYGISIGTGIWDQGTGIDNNTGLYVQSPFTNNPIGVNYGIYLEDQNVATTANYAIYSAGGDAYLNGDLEVTGNMSKGGGSFKIDHPLDPENKYLYHSFVESPEMMNIYNGNIVTDERGYATITLPDWFEALNRDFRYQLTVLDDADGDAFVQAKITARITGNRFTIRTSAPRTEVSWQVTGVRHDAFANQNRIPLEVDKPVAERGRYLHPAAFGVPADRMIKAAPLPKPPPPSEMMKRVTAGFRGPTETAAAARPAAVGASN
ncbi:MAG: hypothetical protein CHACPFDD_02923 [Phycisphaerae bacterium]|nr:hypothetical protein [Phycisphaerae bacterium]